ncbi:MAG: DUF2171 domain-containing protein [Sphingobium sp.]|nr:DUF2171 domain-containing protein [Sphingobium sp.]
MFEKWRIKEHMEVADSTGRHIGTVDEIEGNQIKLTRSDSRDRSHHYIDLDSVDRIADGRVYLKQGTPLPSMGRSDAQLQSANAGDSAAEDATMGGRKPNTGDSPAARQAVGDRGANAGGSAGSSDLPGYENKLFGTSGMGGSGSGSGEH